MPGALNGETTASVPLQNAGASVVVGTLRAARDAVRELVGREDVPVTLTAASASA